MSIGTIIVTIIGSVCGSSGLTGFITWLLQRRDNKANALMLLLQDKLTYLTERVIDEGCITHRLMEQLEQMHKTYKSLGGNGYIEANMQLCRELKRR